MIFSTLSALLSCLTFVGASSTATIVDNRYIQVVYSGSEIDDESQLNNIDVTLSYDGAIYNHYIYGGWEYDESQLSIQDFFVTFIYDGNLIDSNVYCCADFYINDGFGQENEYNSKFVYSSQYVDLSNRQDSHTLVNPIESPFFDSMEYSFTLRIYLIDSNLYQTLVDSGDNYGNGFDNGYDTGYHDGYDDGKSTGYQDGYTKGKEDYENQSGQINSIFDGILSIGLIPIEFFMSIFNFSIFGINVQQIVSALLSIVVIVILLRITLKNV